MLANGFPFERKERVLFFSAFWRQPAWRLAARLTRIETVPLRHRQKMMNHQTIQKRTEPAFIEPMQCKPVTELPSGEKWTFQIKFDGYRCIAVKRRSEVCG
jgi:ATP-dependent DNA ligase